MKCLAKRPEQRYQSMQEFVSDVDKVIAGLRPAAARERSEDLTEPGAYYDDVASSRAARRGRTVGLVLGAAALLALAGAGLLLARKPPAPAAVPATNAAAPESQAKATPPVEPVATAEPGPALKQVIVATEPIAAEISKDGQSLGRSPLAVPVPDGQKVELTVKADGFLDQTVTLDGSETSKNVKLERVPVRGRPAKAPAATAAKPGSKPTPKRPAIGGGEIIDPWSK
jgi:hypothetical protein